MGVQVIERGEQFKLLKSISFFASFTDDDLVTLLEHCFIMKYASGRYIIREDSEGDSFYVILDGSVGVHKKGSNDKARQLASLHKGECFGEMAVLLKTPRTASVIAEDETFIFEIRLESAQKVPPEVSEKLFYQFAVTLAGRMEEMRVKKIKEGAAE